MPRAVCSSLCHTPAKPPGTAAEFLHQIFPSGYDFFVKN